MDLSEIVETKSFNEYQEEWDILFPRPRFFECECNRFIVCIAYDSLSRPRYKQRCATCYRNLGHVYKRVEALEILAGEQPFIDAECKAKRQKAYDDKYAQFRIVYDAHKAKRRQVWRDYYDAYLKSINWALLRVKALTMVGYKCVACKSTDTLQLHHKHYQTLGEESLDDVVILCKKCHDLLHFAQNALRPDVGGM